MTAEVPLTARDPEPGPWLSIVSALYQVEPYLPDFIRSIEAQGDSLDGVEVILVDDGSTDGSGNLADEWAQRKPGLVTVLHQQNRGVAAARNAGLAVARGTWVTFPDPDDMLSDQYLALVRQFLDEHPRTTMAVTNLIFFDEATGTTKNTHPLKFRFARGDVSIDLSRVPDYFQLSASSAAFRRDELTRLDLWFDGRVYPNFEDGHLIGRYLLGQQPPIVGFVEGARYLYRKRAAADSAIDTAMRSRRRYTDVLRHGYLDLLERAAEMGDVPAWLQSEIIYELVWLLRSDEAIVGVSAATFDVAEEYLDLMRAITSHLQADRVEEFGITRLSPASRVALAHGLRGETWHSPVYFEDLDTAERDLKITYWFVGDAPVEEIQVRGRAVTPRSAKTRVVTYAGRPVVRQRIIWLSLSAGAFEIRLDGERQSPRRGPHGREQLHWRAVDVDRVFKNKPRFAAPATRGPRLVGVSRWWRKHFGPKSAERREARMIRFLADSSLVHRVFGGAWVIMDRDYNAWDSGEHLFRYLRRDRRDINAWFVVRRGTADWKRLRAEGFKRLVPYGSLAWKLLALNARFIVSTHADEYVYAPHELRHIRPPGWRFIFLQHGVIHDDISRWLNPKPIRLFVTSTRQEYDYVAGDGSPYAFGTREVIRSGLPRHDRLARVARAARDERDLVVMMPTWRHYLFGKDVTSTNRKALLPDFHDTDFARSWSSLLTAPTLHARARERGLKVVFMPHPNLAPYLDGWDLGGVDVRTYDDSDVQETLARAVALVTDYSSVAFDAAAIRRPVVYFQFDRGRAFGGDHTRRPGYFDYARDGFGPVCETPDEALARLDELMVSGGVIESPFRERVESTFPRPDGRSSERVVRAVESVEKRMRWV